MSTAAHIHQVLTPTLSFGDILLLLLAPGMLESMSRIEAQAYNLLSELGASPVKSVLTAGGGAVNEKWTAMRRAALRVPVTAAKQGDDCDQ